MSDRSTQVPVILMADEGIIDIAFSTWTELTPDCWTMDKSKVRLIAHRDATNAYIVAEAPTGCFLIATFADKLGKGWPIDLCGKGFDDGTVMERCYRPASIEHETPINSSKETNYE